MIGGELIWDPGCLQPETNEAVLEDDRGFVCGGLGDGQDRRGAGVGERSERWGLTEM